MLNKENSKNQGGSELLTSFNVTVDRVKEAVKIFTQHLTEAEEYPYKVEELKDEIKKLSELVGSVDTQDRELFDKGVDSGRTGRDSWETNLLEYAAEATLSLLNFIDGDISRWYDAPSDNAIRASLTLLKACCTEFLKSFGGTSCNSTKES